MPKGKILIADDEQKITAGLSAVLDDEGYSVAVAHDGEQALRMLQEDAYGVVLADLMMPNLDGIALLKEMQGSDIATECIIVTGKATVDSAIEAMRSGAYDYVEKPLDTEKLTRLKALIPKAIEKYTVREANRVLESKLEKFTHFGDLTGQSEQMREIYRTIEAVAPSTASVLILGESGTGKELVARALHNKSDRAKGPFFALNCAALPKDILENELFGHEKGAFTGSTNEKPGAFEMASGGTIFFDEVAEMPPDIQVKLLRALETRTVRRLGGKKEIAVDIRVIAATNKDVQKAIVESELREDLYYRLAVVDLYLPPLRERMGDIRLLATEFLARFAKENQKTVAGFTEAAWDWVVSYEWPGNVRELKNAVERAVIMARGERIDAHDLMPRHIRNSGSTAVVTLPAGSTVSEARRHIVLRKFADAGGDLSRAAKLAGMSDADMRTELLAMVGPGTGSSRNGAPDAEEDEQQDEQPKPAARSTRKKAAAKTRERKTTGKGRRPA
jgi:DNA-binding NtrC family response regulator